MPPYLNFLAPSLEPNHLLDISIPEPGSNGHPSVGPLRITGKDDHSVGLIKRISSSSDGSVVVADDQFRVTSLSRQSPKASAQLEEEYRPEIVEQHQVKGTSGDTWTGLTPVDSGIISATKSGLLTYHRFPLHHDEEAGPSNPSRPLTRQVDAPLLTVASPSSSSRIFAYAGKEVDVTICDVERTFTSISSTSSSVDRVGSKRKKKELEEGEIWRAKNMPQNSLRLRPPVHHLCMTFLTSTSASLFNSNPTTPASQGAPNGEGEGEAAGFTYHLVTGTKAGTIRRYDTRQRKPVSEWKVAREGGVRSVAQIAPEQLVVADEGNYLGVVDLKTGREVYAYANLPTSGLQLLPIPPDPLFADTKAVEYGSPFASLSSDWTIRIHSTLSSVHGNRKQAKSKPKVEGMVGGIGGESIVFTGYSDMPSQKNVAGEDGADGEDGEESDEEVWDGMEEFDDDAEDDDDDEDEDDGNTR